MTTDADDIPPEARRAIAAQFFTLFGGLSLDRQRQRVGNALSKQTIARDRDKVASREAVSGASARAYAAALDRGTGFDAGDVDDIGDFVNEVIAARMRFWNSQPIVEHDTSGHVEWQKIFPRVFRRIKDRDWTSVIDMIETAMETHDRAGWAGAESYFEFYLGMAYRNLGDVKTSTRHFERSFESIRHSNSDPDMKSHAALDYALAIQENPRSANRQREVVDLLKIALDNIPDDHPEALVNILIAAARLSERWFGYFAARIRDTIADSRHDYDWAYLRSNFMEHSGLIDYQKNDIFQEIIVAVDDRLAHQQEARRC